jgi:hypothetical protein
MALLLLSAASCALLIYNLTSMNRITRLWYSNNMEWLDLVWEWQTNHKHNRQYSFQHKKLCRLKIWHSCYRVQ